MDAQLPPIGRDEHVVLFEGKIDFKRIISLAETGSRSAVRKTAQEDHRHSACEVRDRDVVRRSQKGLSTDLNHLVTVEQVEDRLSCRVMSTPNRLVGARLCRPERRALSAQWTHSSSGIANRISNAVLMVLSEIQ